MKQRERCSGRGFDSLHLHQKGFYGKLDFVSINCSAKRILGL